MPPAYQASPPSSRISPATFRIRASIASPFLFGQGPVHQVQAHLQGPPARLAEAVGDGLGADAQRVYVVGFSNGGGMAHRMGCALAGKIAGIAAVSGSYPAHEICAPAAPLPVIAFHGTTDYFVPYEGDSIQPSIPEWAQAWAGRNNCQSEPVAIFNQDNVRGESWMGCDGDIAVTLYTVDGGGHQWLGSPTFEGVGGVVRRINATDIIWDFFEGQP